MYYIYFAVAATCYLGFIRLKYLRLLFSGLKEVIVGELKALCLVLFTKRQLAVGNISVVAKGV